MNCKRCDVEMNLYHPQDGPYFLCPLCNKVEYPLQEKAGKDSNKDSAPRTSTNIGNTYLIDQLWDKENTPSIG